MHGEDFYVRGHALVALGNTGLSLAGPFLRDRLAASEPTERQSAGTGLRLLARKAGPALWAFLAEGADRETRAALAALGASGASGPPAEQRRTDSDKGGAR
jgi:hypothetical protein